MHLSWKVCFHRLLLWVCLTTESGVDRSGHRRCLLHHLPRGNQGVEVWSRRRGGGGGKEEEVNRGGGGGGGVQATHPSPKGPLISSSVEVLAAAAVLLPGGRSHITNPAYTSALPEAPPPSRRASCLLYTTQFALTVCVSLCVCRWPYSTCPPG